MKDQTRSHIVELSWFLALATIPVVALCWAGLRMGGLEQAPWIPLACMMCPMLAALVVQKVIARGPLLGTAGLWLAWPRWLPVVRAMALIGLLTLAGFGLTLLLWPQLFTGLAYMDSRLAVPGNLAPAWSIAVALVVTWFVAPVLNLPLMLGEELGWRGFMTPRLVALFGRRGVLVGGVIWGLWHVPGIVLLGYNYPEHPWMGVLVFCAICTVLSVLFSYSMQRGRSVLTPALQHGVLNQLAVLGMLSVDKDSWVDVFHAPTGLLMLAVLIPAAWLCYRRIDAALLGTPPTSVRGP